MTDAEIQEERQKMVRHTQRIHFICAFTLGFVCGASTILTISLWNISN